MQLIYDDQFPPPFMTFYAWEGISITCSGRINARLSSGGGGRRRGGAYNRRRRRRRRRRNVTVYTFA